MAGKTFLAKDILHTWNSSKSGTSKLTIEDNKMYRVGNFTFDEMVKGHIASVTFKENGNELPLLAGQTTPMTAFNVDTVELTELGKRIASVQVKRVEVEEKRLDVDIKKLDKEIAAL